MSRNDKLIPLAINAIKNNIEIAGRTINGEFEGYVSSFASSVIQSGLIATLSFYTDGENKDKSHGGLDKTDGRRNIFLQSIMFMLAQKDGLTGNAANKRLLEYVMEKVYNAPNVYSNINFDFVRVQVDLKVLNEIEDEILECAIALKLALRTFKLDKK